MVVCSSEDFPEIDFPATQRGQLIEEGKNYEYTSPAEGNSKREENFNDCMNFIQNF